jgi:hypothetical protein
VKCSGIYVLRNLFYMHCTCCMIHGLGCSGIEGNGHHRNGISSRKESNDAVEDSGRELYHDEMRDGEI